MSKMHYFGNKFSKIAKRWGLSGGKIIFRIVQPKLMRESNEDQSKSGCGQIVRQNICLASNHIGSFLVSTILL